MVDVNLVITLNVNGLNTPIKGQIVRADNKTDWSVCCLQETYFNYKDTYRLHVKGWRMIYHVNTNQKKMGVTILISDRADQRKERYQG